MPFKTENKYSVSYKKYILKFNFPGGTSRGILTEKTSYIITVWHNNNSKIKGTGEVSLIPGLSPDNLQFLEKELDYLSHHPNKALQKDYSYLPALQFGIETALKDLESGGNKILYPSGFTKGKSGIKINGLVWMGTKQEMLQRIKDKVDSGFSCIKLKIGAINFDDEVELLKYIRKEFGNKDLELRLDANGAFSPNDAIEKINRLSEYSIHSIEQPIKQHQWHKMAEICNNSPIPIALDEELIGISNSYEMNKLITTVKPQYIILKPSLLGGLQKTDEWISLANKSQTGWWITSALESNIGLNAIAQWTFIHKNNMPQGLGTGQVFSNNIPSPLTIRGEELWYDTSR